MEDREAILWLLLGIAITLSAIALFMAFSKTLPVGENKRVIIGKDEKGRIILQSE